MTDDAPPRMHATTILMVRKGGRVVIGGDGQVTLGNTVMKGDAHKIRRLYGGKVVTAGAAFTIAEAMAVEGDRIVAVGSNDEVRRLAGPNTESIDLAGKSVLPGLIDSHVHPLGAAMYEFDHPVPEMETVADVLAYVARRAEERPDGEWIKLQQVFITRLRDRRYPTRAELEDILSES